MSSVPWDSESAPTLEQTPPAGQSGGGVREELRQMEFRYRSLIEQIPAITYTVTVEGGSASAFISPQVERFLGYSPNEFPDQAAWEGVIYPEDRGAFEEASTRSESGEAPFLAEYRAIAKDGRLVWLRDEATLVEDPMTGIGFWQGIILDVSRAKEAEERLRDAERKNRAIVEQLPAVTFLDPAGENPTSRFVSPQVKAILGCTREQWLASPDWLYDHLHPDDRPWVWEQYSKHRANGTPFLEEFRIVRDDGRELWISEEATLIFDDAGRPWAYQGLMHDTTELRTAKHEIAVLTARDELTGLATRELLEEKLEAAIYRAAGLGHALALVHVDLGNFEEIIDEYGRNVGDKLLREVATRLGRAVGEGDVVARDKDARFFVMLAGLQGRGDPAAPGAASTQREAAQATVDRIDTLMSGPAVVGGQMLTPQVGIGLAMYPEDASDAAELFGAANDSRWKGQDPS